MSNYNNDIMVVAEKINYVRIKNLLEGFGFHKNYIFSANSQKAALFEIDLIQQSGNDIDILIFDYRDPKTEIETLINLRKLEKSKILSTITKVVMLSPDNINFVKNYEQFKESEIIFIAFEELETAIKNSLRLED